MKITVEDSDNREKILHIEVDDDRLEKHVKQANRHHGKHVNIPGFRKGKAPSSIVENFLGRDWLVNKALESLNVPDYCHVSTGDVNEIVCAEFGDFTADEMCDIFSTAAKQKLKVLFIN